MSDEGSFAGHLVAGGFSYSYRIRRCARPATEPMVLIPGLYQDKTALRQVSGLLSDIAHTVVIDLPGYSAADPVPASTGYEVAAYALGHALDVLGLPRVNLVTISHGYTTAFRYAQAHPDRVARTVLSGPPERSEKLRSDLGLLAHHLAHGALDDFARDAIDFFFSAEGEGRVERRDHLRVALRDRLSRISETERLRYLGATRRAVDHPALPAGTVPDVSTLILLGEYDHLCPPAWTSGLRARLGGAALVQVPETDHLVVHEQPRAWADVVRAFVLHSVDQGSPAPVAVPAVPGG